ncbi:hypothetical protein SAMN04487818_111262 [Actinokineospora terrae]|uniref:Uncharacterized protein n=1 Tax=Actinokineospora terrae TaxID=155974 RepID=A0A1H9WW30_9PSEU|nr:hypothetical protein SAMN04487818_111262 [Actinokineospora terrae]
MWVGAGPGRDRVRAKRLRQGKRAHGGAKSPPARRVVKRRPAGDSPFGRTLDAMAEGQAANAGSAADRTVSDKRSGDMLDARPVRPVRARWVRPPPPHGRQPISHTPDATAEGPSEAPAGPSPLQVFRSFVRYASSAGLPASHLPRPPCREPQPRRLPTLMRRPSGHAGADARPTVADNPIRNARCDDRRPSGPLGPPHHGRQAHWLPTRCEGQRPERAHAGSAAHRTVGDKPIGYTLDVRAARPERAPLGRE